MNIKLSNAVLLHKPLKQQANKFGRIDTVSGLFHAYLSTIKTNRLTVDPIHSEVA